MVRSPNNLFQKKMSRLYDNIMKVQRAESEYFRVAFYGLGFPNFLANKEFVYRGSAYERLSDFTARMQNLFPGATVRILEGIEEKK